MTRIGKILVVVFIFLGVFAFPVSAQQMSKAALQRMYMDYLREEGYMPSIDEDGDILFKVAGDSYYIIIDEDDLQFFQIYMGLNLGSIPLQSALNAANYSNRRSKVAKVYISTDGKRATIKIELLVNKPEDFKPLFSRGINLIRNAEDNFTSQID
jgi:hypothetical protein